MTPSDLAADFSRGLTPQQVTFVREYLARNNATRAAIAAGYSAKTAKSQGSRLLTSVNVRAALAAALQPKMDALEITAERVLQQVSAIAFSNLADVFDGDGRVLTPDKWPMRAKLAVRRFEITREKVTDCDNREASSTTTSERGFKLGAWDKLRALELLMRHLRMLSDQTEVDVNVSVEAIQKKHRQALSHVGQEELLALEQDALRYIAAFDAATSKNAAAPPKATR